MSRFEQFILVCNNVGREGDTKARCGKQGADELLARLRAQVEAKGHKGRVRIIRSGCLDLCAKGCAAVAFSGAKDKADPNAQETWFTHLSPDDAEPLYAAHVERNEPYVPLKRREKR